MPDLRAPLLLLVLAVPTLAPSAPPPPLRVATWNLEWLASPTTALKAREACLAGAQHAALPCETALDARRSGADFARLRHYAAAIGADVIAFQEVEDAGTAARVFTDHAFCLTGSPTVQNLGFAIRRGLAFRCDPDLAALAPGERGRRGAVLVIDPGGPRELHLLGVHLKSGCASGGLTSGAGACGQLRRQLPQLGTWMRTEARAGHRFLVLGDFNRSWENGKAEADALLGEDAGEPLFDDPGLDSGFTSCFTGQTFTRYIDHLLVGRTGGLRPVAGSFFRVRYTPPDVRHYRLSDHCPTGVVLQFTAPAMGFPQASKGGLAY
jgi:endonuclease/exonuclease/phosphatase family metal-dependent hydrolase